MSSTGGNTFAVSRPTRAGVSGGGATSFVNGALRRGIGRAPTRQTVAFPVGAGTTYAPISVVIPGDSVTATGTLTGSTTTGNHPNLSGSGINPAQDVNRYWTLTPGGGLALGTYTPTFSWASSGDTNGTLTTGTLVVRKYAASTWTGPTTSSSYLAAPQPNETATSYSATFGDYAVGNLAPASRLVITGSGTQTAGGSQNLTITAKDGSGNTVTGYTGTHSLVFTGANASSNPPTDPTVTNATGTAVAFGSATSITFTNGVATVSAGNNGAMVLYNAESATIAATDGTIDATGADRLTVAVSAAPLAKFALALTNPQTNGTAFTGTNTLTAEDAWGNTISSFNAATDNVTITADAPLSGTVSGLGSGSTNVLNQVGDFSSGVAHLTTLGMKYTGSAASGTFTASAVSGKSGMSGSVTIGKATAICIVTGYDVPFDGTEHIATGGPCTGIGGVTLTGGTYDLTGTAHTDAGTTRTTPGPGATPTTRRAARSRTTSARPPPSARSPATPSPTTDSRTQRQASAPASAGST